MIALASVFAAGLHAIMISLLVFFLALNSLDALLLLLAIPELWSDWRLADAEYVRTLVGNDAMPPVSVVTAVYNQGAAACETAAMLLALDYPRSEVIIVNDGSTDETMAALMRAFDLYQVPPAFTINTRTSAVRGYYRSRTNTRLLCIDKEHGGIADALNAGINAARFPYTFMVNMGVVLEPDALLWITRPMVLDRNVMVVSPSVSVGNGGRMVNGRFVPAASRRILFGIHTVEYLRTFVFERLGWNRIASNLVYPSNAALFKHDHLQAIGGFLTTSEAPGVDLAIRLHRYLTDQGANPRFLVIPDAVAWRDLPEGIAEQATLRAQRQRGTLQALWRHRIMMMNPEYGMMGVLVLPVVALRYLVAPFLELGGLIGLIIGSLTGVLGPGFLWAYLAVTVGYPMLLAAWTVLLEALTFRRYARRADLARLALYAMLESLGYRQFLAWVRVRALFANRSLRRPYGQYALTKTA